MPFLPARPVQQPRSAGRACLELRKLVCDYLPHLRRCACSGDDLHPDAHDPPSKLHAPQPLLARSSSSNANQSPRSYKDLKKSDLEAALDDFIAQHSSRFSSNSDLAGYFASRSRTLTSPIKKEKETVKEEAEKGLKVVKRRVTKAAEEIAAE